MSFRRGISDDPKEILVYAADNLAQFTLASTGVASKSDRPLPAAAPRDIVVLDREPDPAYLSWLRSLGLGTDRIVVYDCLGTPLAGAVAENPGPVLERVRPSEANTVFVPWFSGEMENRAARALNAESFGARADLTWAYNNKAGFKSLCRRLDIPVVEDTPVEIHGESHRHFKGFSEAVTRHLEPSSMALVRAVMDNAGVSLVFKTRGGDTRSLYDILVRHRVERVLVEPFLDIRTSPNDQWIVTRKGDIRHMGIREQICENGTHHTGTFKFPGDDTPQDLEIKRISRTLVKEMAESGYVGVAGIDYIVTNSGRIFPVENNARFNGSSYVSLILDRLAEQGMPADCWKFMKARTSPCSFDALSRRLAPILYNGARQASVFPYNCENLADTGAFSIIILAPDARGITDLESRLVRLDIH